MSSILAVMYREFLIRRSGLWIFFDMILPLLYMVLFGVSLNRAMAGGMPMSGQAVPYNDFFLAGVLSMSCFGSATNQSYGFFVDRDNGILYEFLTYPMTRGQLLLGKILFQCLMSVVQCLLALLAAVYLLDVQLRMSFVPLVFLGVMVGIAGWFFFFATIAFLIRRNDTFNTVINALYFILIFLSSMFYPLEHVPAWIRISSLLNPLTWLTDILRFLTIGVGQLSIVFLEAAVFGIFLLVSFWFAVRTLQDVA